MEVMGLGVRAVWGYKVDLLSQLSITVDVGYTDYVVAPISGLARIHVLWA